MKKQLLTLSAAFFMIAAFSQAPQIISLNQPDLSKGLNLMKTLSVRNSIRVFDSTDLKLQDLSDLLWAANGINRPESGKRTAPSSMNSQETDIYVALRSGVYFYNAQKSHLELISANDIRPLVADRQVEAAKAPVMIILVGDISRVKFGNDSSKIVTASMDAGMVSQNISLFCASVGFSTVPRGTMNYEKVKQELKLRSTQYLMLNHPVSYQTK